MQIIRIDKLKDDSILQRNNYVDGVTFLDYEQRKTVLDACNHNEDILRNWLNKIKVQYNDLQITDNNISYSVENTSGLTMVDLSSGEKYLLYLLACKELNKKLIAAGLYERLGNRLESVATDIIKDYKNLIIVYYNTFLPKEIKSFEVEDI